MDTLKTVLVAVVVGVVIAGAVVMTRSGAPEAKLGAVSGPDMPYKYISIGGAQLHTQFSAPIQATTTVICSMQSPAATSTLLAGGVNLASTTATTSTSLSISKSTAPFTVGTVIASTTLASQELKSLPAATTTGTFSANIVADRIFPPSTYMVVAQQGSVGLLNQQGTCSAIWSAL